MIFYQNQCSLTQCIKKKTNWVYVPGFESQNTTANQSAFTCLEAAEESLGWIPEISPFLYAT